MKIKLFISGGTGFFGKNILANILHNQNAEQQFDEVIVLTRNKGVFLEKYPEFISDKITFFNGDVREFNCSRTDFNYIIHLAADASKDLNDNNPLEMIDVVINGTKKILSFAQQQTQLKKILFTSSGAVYGNIPYNIEGVNETDRFDIDFNNPINAYAQAKRTAEMMCNIYLERFNMPIIIARCFAFKGKYLPQDGHFAIANFIKEANEKKTITIKSDGNSKRSYMDAEYLASVLLKLLTNTNNKHSIYNVGSDKGKTIKEWAFEIANEIGNVNVNILEQVQHGYSAGSNYIPKIERLKNEF